jgi:flavin-dependent dehydrogenase
VSGTTSHRFDVVVAGAGPAGAHLAIRLARAGYTVALLDRQRFPRRKPCGEVMSPGCVPLLDEIGMREAVLARGVRRIRGMRLLASGVEATGRFADQGTGIATADHAYALRREVLDLIAVEQARACPGVTLLEDHAVVGLVRAADGRVLGLDARDPGGAPLRLQAAFTIGADGVRSRVARELGVQRSLPWLQKVALVARYSGVAALDHAEVHFFPDGYIALSAVDSGLHTLNLVLARSAVPPGGRRALEDELARRLQAVPSLAERFAGRAPEGPMQTCGTFAGRTTAQTFDGAALVGDACGYVDPVTGEGLFFAMRGAALLSETLAAALAAKRTDRAALRPYLRARRREFAPRYAMAKLLQRGLRHPALVHGFLALLRARPRLADLLVTLTGDLAHPSVLMRPGTWIRALRRPTALAARGA